MDPLTLALIGGGVGGLKSIADQQQAQKDRQMQAQIARFSPWSGMQANPGAITKVSPVGDIGSGALTGAMFASKNPAAAPGSAGAVGASAPIDMGAAQPNMSTMNTSPWWMQR